MAPQKGAVDGLLGTGWYDEWRQIERDVANEKKRTEVNENRFSSFKDSRTTDRLWFDMRRLERVAHDYRELMDAISRGPVDKKRVGAVHDVLTLALGVAHHDNDALDAAFAAGLVAAFALIPFAVWQERAKLLSEILKALKERLEQAQREAHQAVAQGLINASITAITAVMPSVGLLARGGIAVGEWLLDDALGPSTSTAATVGGKASITLSQLGGAASEVERVGKTTKKIAKTTGNAATVTGIIFDVNEIRVGISNVDKLERLMSQAKKAYDSLLSEITSHKPGLTELAKQYERWQVSIRSVRQDATSIRAALLVEMKATGYSPRN